MAKKNSAALAVVDDKIQKLTPEQEREATDAASKEYDARLLEQETAMAARISAAMSQLKDVSKAKAEQFEEQQTDFWKPEKAGDFVQGVFAGTLDTKYKTHCIGTLDSHGKPLMIRCNGTKALTDKLKRVEPGTMVRITYLRSEKMGERTFKHFSVGVLKS